MSGISPLIIPRSGSTDVDRVHSQVPAYLFRTFDQRFGPAGQKFGNTATAHFCQESYKELIGETPIQKRPSFKLPATVDKIQPFIPLTSRATEEMQQNTAAWHKEIDTFRGERHKLRRSLRTLQAGYLKRVFKCTLEELEREAKKFEIKEHEAKELEAKGHEAKNEAPNKPADVPFIYVSDVARITRQFLISNIFAATVPPTPEQAFTSMKALQKVAHKALFKETFWPYFQEYSKCNNDNEVRTKLDNDVKDFLKWLRSRNINTADNFDSNFVASISGQPNLNTTARWYHAYWLKEELEHSTHFRREENTLWVWALRCMTAWETIFFNCHSDNYITLRDEMGNRPFAPSPYVS